MSDIDWSATNDLGESRWSLDLVERPTTWTGDGLPPVGTVCEWFSEDYGWLVGRVVGHDDDLSVISHSDGYTGCHPEEVRPLRTPEQIAEEERKAAVKVIADLLEHWDVEPVAAVYAANALWNAGYRKAGDA